MVKLFDLDRSVEAHSKILISSDSTNNLDLFFPKNLQQKPVVMLRVELWGTQTVRVASEYFPEKKSWNGEGFYSVTGSQLKSVGA